MMESKWFWILLTVVLLEGWSNGCLEHERVALLQLRSFFDDPYSLINWVDAKDSDCCQWERVECNITSRRVIQLSLNSTRTLRYGRSQYGYLNPSVFLQFQELKSLYLTWNQIAGFVDNKGFKWFPGLDNLETLDLTGNYLDNNFLLHVGGLSSLLILNLGSNRLKGSVDIQELNKLAKLKKLDLSINKIESLRFSQDSERQLKLLNLEELDLSLNFLNNSILEQLSGLSNLKSLNLGSNLLKVGSTNIKELEALSGLEEFDFSYNELHGFPTLQETRSFRKLRVAKLDGVFISGSVSLLQLLEAFPSVKTLSLSGNHLNKTISAQELHLSSNVEELILESSYLSNNILETIGALTSLKTLTLSNCGLTGTLPTRGWCDLRNLEELDLSKNALEGTFPSCLNNLTYLDISSNHFLVPESFISFANYSHLEVLFINQNNFVREPITQTSAPTPKFQLKVFGMANCTTKGLSKGLPNFLYHQYDLRYLELSYNNFGGKLPSWLLENNTRLQQFFLTGNSFMGHLQLPRHINIDMFEIDMSLNNIQGQVPMNICSTFPYIEVLSLSQNEFEGDILPCLGGLKSLSRLDLSYNNFSGGILKDLAKSNSLSTLRLSNNNLSGKIVPAIFSTKGLSELYLDGNNFDGEIPQIDISAVGVPVLSIIHLSNNHLSGKIPRWIWNVSGLQTLDLSSNNLDGLISFELCNLDWLKYLDLSQNNLSGSLPSCFNQTNIQHLHISRNRISGPLPFALYNSTSLVSLDLSQNNLSGKIPKWIGTLSALNILILKANHFEGEIPSKLCQLNSLSIVDLSQNKLFGAVPFCLSNLTLEPDGVKYFWDGVYSSGIRILEDLKFKSSSGQFYRRSYVEEQVEFVTKKGLYTYSGNILIYMSGIDLSCNRLTGQIPLEIGDMNELRSLNLSHNNLAGFIPSTFAKLKQIESLDLSYNNLSGKIPMQLMELNSIAVFKVSYNNLSGNIPYKAQFATFDESSYLKNPFLCGPPLNRSCNEFDSPPIVMNASDVKNESGWVDTYVFYVSFSVSYSIVLTGIATVLYINPYWRKAWFYFIEHCITTCHFFIADNLLRSSMFRRSS